MQSDKVPSRQCVGGGSDSSARWFIIRSIIPHAAPVRCTCSGHPMSKNDSPCSLPHHPSMCSRSSRTRACGPPTAKQHSHNLSERALPPDCLAQETLKNPAVKLDWFWFIPLSSLAIAAVPPALPARPRPQGCASTYTGQCIINQNY